MKTKELDILNTFIKAPDLKINSETYPFENFNFLEEEITESEFQFPENSIIGMQAEACFKEYLHCSKRYKLLVSNLQIQGEKKTLGEVDYIVQNLRTNQVVHIELACKFYLYDVDAGASEEDKWIGPNRKDCLYEKLEKMKWKQFPLLHKKETIERLETLNIEVPAIQELCLKASLFLPKKIKTITIPQNYAACVIGYWIKYKDFIDENKNASYAIPSKKEWLLPPEYIDNWHSFSEIQMKISEQIKQFKSPLIYKRTFIKTECLFVVWW